MPAQRHQSLCRNVDVGVGLAKALALSLSFSTVEGLHASTVSSTLITPGWRSVRNFLSAFFARASRDLFATQSKAKMLQFELSS